MKHVTEQDWVEFAGGSPSAEVSERIRRHVGACDECARKQVELESWDGRLADEGMRLRSALSSSEVEVERMLAEAMKRLAAQPRQRQAMGLAEGIAILRALLEPVIGAGTIRLSMEAARRRSTGGEDWVDYVTALSENIQIVCGLAVGRLVARAGMSIQI